MTQPTQTQPSGIRIIRTSAAGRVIDFSPDTQHLNARLVDFDINGTSLKFDHSKWLDAAVARVNSSHRTFIWHIWIDGGASLTGLNVQRNNAYNYGLARSRAAEVEKYLKARITVPGAVYHDASTMGIQLPGLQRHAVGVENDNDRAVYVQITSDSTIPPRPPVPVSVPLSKNFAIRFVKGASVGAFLPAVDIADFEIADTDNKLYAMYRYSGDSVGAGLSLANISISYTYKGGWKDFHTDDALNVADFDGSSRFSTAGLPMTSTSINYLSVTPAGGAKTTPSPLVVDTGTTLGGGASFGIPGTGWLKFRWGPVHYAGAYPA